MDGDIANKKIFLKPEDLAEYLNISIPTIYRLVNSRKIPFHKVGGSLRFKLAEIDEHLKSNRFDTIN
jgi:excisionase family DNA binding protein